MRPTIYDEEDPDDCEVEVDECFCQECKGTFLSLAGLAVQACPYCGCAFEGVVDSRR